MENVRRHNFTKRLQHMLNNEFEITDMETQIASKSAKYYEVLSDLKTALGKQDYDMRKIRLHMEKMRKCNETFAKTIGEEQHRLQMMNSRVEKLKKQDAEERRKQEEQIEGELMKKHLLHRLKEDTNVYFNLDALPRRFQGVIVHDPNGLNEWKPFAIDVREWIQQLEEVVGELDAKEIITLDDSNKTIVL